MALEIDEQDLSKFILIGDRVLIKPKDPQSKTKSGLYLPPSVQEKETVHSGNEGRARVSHSGCFR